MHNALKVSLILKIHLWRLLRATMLMVVLDWREVGVLHVRLSGKSLLLCLMRIKQFILTLAPNEALRSLKIELMLVGMVS